MFTPPPAEVRRFFCRAWAKRRAGQPMQPIETLAADWIAEHPEYHADFADEASAIARTYPELDGQANPFLHLAMHLSISEQCSIDQPRGIRHAVEQLASRQGDLHRAHHEVMAFLGQMLADAQSSGRPFDGNAYLDAIQRRATRD